MALDSWTQALEQGWRHSRTLLLLAATDTAAVPGISAAGASPQARLGTAAADAELLLLGPGGTRCHALPPLPAGVSPALISHVVLSQLGLLERTRVLDLGCAIAAAVPHLRLPGLESAGPARCLSTGQALVPARVEALVQRGSAWGRRWDPAEPLLLAECVPGGTTTAMAVLEGLGVAAAGLVSGSLRQPVHGLKADLVAQGLAAASFEAADLTGVAHPLAFADPLNVLAALGDPMQAFAAGLVGAAAARGTPVLLAGGSQMAAVLALALALAEPGQRPALAERLVVATTAWVAEEAGSNLALLLERIGARWQVRPRLEVAALRFHGCSSSALRDYERGYVKEGVGAGGLALLWQLAGRQPGALAEACDAACRLELGA
ncbi:nicotinate-nucleotide--dimethylbenzimidazole phosphoribosyltransferase [Cyanobium sp. BA5m-21]|uniref:nicotinate-nucleotide--dimethylbenzimidazole phosphoribosyltransferase n=1 Tax=unclassified Cyanobium TaxID=2627006 RepID=UPI0020CCE19C|nr:MULTISPECIES: nicotinate-nucleotide--dimethylbenzimidazole phosphoribosyltransferase [unclassified Cyanobium]MCP9903176.1 nicotinate-nucleotide--dimethylbenzimidazole phosphoribosyltransferase [Cyanobium sp. BA5m-10]MCP9906425.1 nicotinate-nucleotide--dimethylbenzimidazole phosphoribosyltransferase [Cyanobium sp. BA5m-21]